MARIKQVGVGRKTTGTIDGINYYVRNGETFARAAPNMPASVYNTTEARIRQAIFKFIQMHLKHHLRTIRQTITAKNGSPTNRYYSLNSKPLSLALQPLAELYVEGEDVTITDVEAAISAYAAEHPTAIKIAAKSGYQEVYLTGEWPDTITLNANAGDSTVIIIVNEHGEQTTINADGTVTVTNGSNGSGSNSGSNTGGNSGSGTNTGGNSGSGDNTGGNSGNSGNTGSVTPSVPKLTISRTGTGTSSITANGNPVSSGAEIAANTEVAISITPAEDATPTASLNGNTITLTENDGVYSGTFQMPSSNATLVINSGGTTGGGSGDMN